jgi:hypothetical protein
MSVVARVPAILVVLGFHRLTVTGWGCISPQLVAVFVMVAGMRARDLLLASVATARITRFVTVDKLGEWLIARRVRDWGGVHEREWLEAHLDPEGVREVMEDPEGWEPQSWQRRLSMVVDCGHCVSMWAGLGALAAVAVSRQAGLAGRLVRWVLTGLGVSYVVGHVWARLDSE